MDMVVEESWANDGEGGLVRECGDSIDSTRLKNWMPARGRRGRGRGDYNDNEYTSGSDSDGPPSRGAGSSEYTKKVGMFCFCVAAIYAAYITQGVLQENMWVANSYNSFTW